MSLLRYGQKIVFTNLIYVSILLRYLTYNILFKISNNNKYFNDWRGESSRVGEEQAKLNVFTIRVVTNLI